jgi:chromosome segregation ATPase
MQRLRSRILSHQGLSLDAVLPSAAAGINEAGAHVERTRERQAAPLLQQSLNTRLDQTGNKQPDDNLVLSRQLLTARKNLAKKEEEAAAFVQQVRSRDQKIASSEQKLQDLERKSQSQVAEISSLKRAIASSSSAGSTHSERMRQLMSSLQEANSQLCDRMPQVCRMLLACMMG